MPLSARQQLCQPDCTHSAAVCFTHGRCVGGAVSAVAAGGCCLPGALCARHAARANAALARPCRGSFGRTDCGSTGGPGHGSYCITWRAGECPSRLTHGLSRRTPALPCGCLRDVLQIKHLLPGVNVPIIFRELRLTGTGCCMLWLKKPFLLRQLFLLGLLTVRLRWCVSCRDAAHMLSMHCRRCGSPLLWWSSPAVRRSQKKSMHRRQRLCPLRQRRRRRCRRRCRWRERARRWTAWARRLRWCCARCGGWAPSGSVSCVATEMVAVLHSSQPPLRVCQAHFRPHRPV